MKGLGLNDLDDANRCFFYGERGAGTKRLDYDDICYIEAKDEQTWIWLDHKNYIEVNEAFGNIVCWLPKSDFAQVHRSFVVSLKQVIGMTNKHVLLPNIEINRGDKGKYKYFYQWIDENTIKGKFQKYGMDRQRGEKNG